MILVVRRIGLLIMSAMIIICRKRCLVFPCQHRACEYGVFSLWAVAVEATHTHRQAETHIHKGPLRKETFRTQTTIWYSRWTPKTLTCFRLCDIALSVYPIRIDQYGCRSFHHDLDLSGDDDQCVLLKIFDHGSNRMIAVDELVSDKHKWHRAVCGDGFSVT